MTFNTIQPVVAQRTRGHASGPITRLISPGELGHVLKPFVFLDAFDVQPSGPVGFGWHPHSGIATVTVHFEGESWAEESNGSRHSLPAGSVEWVAAGRGVWHRGGPNTETRVRGFQLWLSLDEENELLPAVSRYFDPSELPVTGPVRVVLGEHDGNRSPVPSPPGVTYLQVELEPGRSLTLDPVPGNVAFIAVVAGSVHAHANGNTDALEAGELGILHISNAPIILTAGPATQLVYGTAPPHPHPLILGQYSVHTNAASLQQGEKNIAELHALLREQDAL